MKRKVYCYTYKYNKVVVKAHGSSDELAFYNALKVCYNLIKKDVVNKMKEEMK